MSIKLDGHQNLSNESLKIQYLPAEIESDGEANVDEYFNNYTINENGHLTNSLRGFPLDGTKFAIPSNMRGVVFQESRGVVDENCEKLIKITGTFEDFTYWNYDKIPSAADKLRQALEVSIVADELAKPVSEQDIQNEIDSKLKCVKK